MQKKTEYSNSLVSKTLPIIRRASNNYLYFNQIENILCFAVWTVRFFVIPHRVATSFKYSFIFWLLGNGRHGASPFSGLQLYFSNIACAGGSKGTLHMLVSFVLVIFTRDFRIHKSLLLSRNKCSELSVLASIKASPV